MTNTEKTKKKCINVDNPNNHAFGQARGYPKRPKNWKELLKTLTESKRAKKRKRNEHLFLPTDADVNLWYKDDY